MSAKYTIQEILEDHWSSFTITTTNIRPVVHKEVLRVINCGNPDNGCRFYECPKCGKYRFVPFRCHSRFCNTCGVAYQSDRADTISLKLLRCKHRHVVFTIPKELRPFFRKDRNLLNVLFRSSAQVISDWLYNQNHKEKFTAGMVVGLHTFGRDLKWNPHIHMLLTEGAVGKFTEWKSISHIPFTMLRKRWQTTLLYNLRDALDIKIFSMSDFKKLISLLYKNYPDGFYVNAPSKRDFNSPMAVANYITRYIGRPAMAQSRITNYDGENVSWWYQRHEDNEIINVTEHAHSFIKKLIIHIPEQGFHMLRYYGLYASPYETVKHLIHITKRELKSVILAKQRWIFRIELSFHYDPLKCPCGEYMEFKDIYIPGHHTHPPPFMLKSRGRRRRFPV
ncbi:MAG: transposase [Firmicutes bacterium]|nr:transposase [Bacillota bacterium]